MPHRERESQPIVIEFAEFRYDPSLAVTSDLVSDGEDLVCEPELGLPIGEQQRERASHNTHPFRVGEDLYANTKSALRAASNMGCGRANAC